MNRRQSSIIIKENERKDVLKKVSKHIRQSIFHSAQIDKVIIQHKLLEEKEPNV